MKSSDAGNKVTSFQNLVKQIWSIWLRFSRETTKPLLCFRRLFTHWKLSVGSAGFGMISDQTQSEWTERSFNSTHLLTNMQVQHLLQSCCQIHHLAASCHRRHLKMNVQQMHLYANPAAAAATGMCFITWLETAEQRTQTTVTGDPLLPLWAGDGSAHGHRFSSALITFNDAVNLWTEL